VEIKNAAARGRKRWSEYNAHRNLLARCKDSNNRQYKDYGGRGISVCDKWKGPDGFKNFISDVGMRPSGIKGKRPLYALDRIDNDGNYEPGNVRWVTYAHQNKNTRQRRIENFTDEQIKAEIWRRFGESA